MPLCESVVVMYVIPVTVLGCKHISGWVLFSLNVLFGSL